MQLAALPLVLLSLLHGAAWKAPDPGNHELMGSTPGVQHCPVWFEDAPPLGAGRPRPVPVAGLEAAIVCRYYGPPGGIHVPGEEDPHTNLIGERAIERRATAVSLARAFDRLAPYPHPRKEVSLCPNESSGGFYVRFAYRDGHEASARAITTGCRRVVAGTHGRPLFLPTYLQRRLAGIIDPD